MYGTLTDNQLHPAPRDGRAGGAVVCACALLLGGCSLAVVKESDIFYLKHDVEYLFEEVQDLKRDVRDLSRGYKVVPIKVTITNATESVQKEDD